MRLALPRRLRHPLAGALALALATSGCAVSGVVPVEVAAQRPSFAGDLTVVSWNAGKAGERRLRDELRSLVAAQQPHLVFLQEVPRAGAAGLPLPGFFAGSWRHPWPSGETFGVLTLASFPSRRVTPLPTRHRELGVATPKVSLVSEHALAGGARLLAANVHLLNFERWGTARLRAQLDDLRSALAHHDGPVLWVGDFNAWSVERLQLVEDVARWLGLLEVAAFPEGRRTGDQGSGWMNALLGVDPALPLDRVYYRGLRLRDADVLAYRSSDHPPLRVRFALPRPRA